MLIVIFANNFRCIHDEKDIPFIDFFSNPIGDLCPNRPCVPTIFERRESMEYYLSFESEYSRQMCHVIKGDTVIGNKSYKKLFEDGGYVSALREEGHRVYSIASVDMYGKPNTKESLWYDFNLGLGDSVVLESSILYVQKVDYILARGVIRKRFHMYEAHKKWPEEYNFKGVWVEGIGSSFGPTLPYGWGKDGGTTLMDDCFEGGVVIFSKEDFERVAGEGEETSAPHICYPVPSPAANTGYDLQGRRVTGTPRPGVYIQGGRKKIVK